jgi:membrane protein involved in colicin uptake
MDALARLLMSPRILVTCLAIAMLGAASPASAIELQPIGPRINSLQDNRVIDLQALRNQQQRQDFQQRQQRLRDDDRGAVTRQRPDLDVPVMKPRCRTTKSGNSYVTTCD